MSKKYKNIKKKYLADALSFLGFRYMIFDNEDGTKEYTFEDTFKFQHALNGLLKFKKEINNL
ncbi:hypothetical protein FDB15_03980 [Clostridium botulinum]|uniref:hypothetical protein n=1 Tax=unclassified Clostridium TaxID=2614128 RepID=UPI0013CD445F|nr:MULTISPECIES: hypothetical protein [unclassified Clostridium]NFH99493.1 hypothetical protein [Clostridium botulinum]NFI62172.1 hypothetical protein [Clostridium botulinum]NFJ42622.1 hypothetical protein [Clostridium botulinum]NFJ46507.1 hypothetical protein [Clostridium botulinum]NFK26451.1 hypothetical protein [Clostridium botulinum]